MKGNVMKKPPQYRRPVPQVKPAKPAGHKRYIYLGGLVLVFAGVAVALVADDSRKVRKSSNLKGGSSVHLEVKDDYPPVGHVVHVMFEGRKIPVAKVTNADREEERVELEIFSTGKRSWSDLKDLERSW